MIDKLPDWDFINSLAKAQGVSAEARKKWRQRGSVPHRWRLPLLIAANRMGRTIPIDAFQIATKAAA